MFVQLSKKKAKYLFTKYLLFIPFSMVYIFSIFNINNKFGLFTYRCTITIEI
jgi:hypothetical protein